MYLLFSILAHLASIFFAFYTDSVSLEMVTFPEEMKVNII
jgi:hypothetical protein